METNDKVRFISRDIIKTYTTFIKNRVEAKDVLIIASGVDCTKEAYFALFGVVLAYLFDFESKVDSIHNFDKEVIDVCLKELNTMLINNGSMEFVKTYYTVLYFSCITLYKTVAKEVFIDGM